MSTEPWADPAPNCDRTCTYCPPECPRWTPTFCECGESIYDGDERCYECERRKGERESEAVSVKTSPHTNNSPQLHTEET